MADDIATIHMSVPRSLKGRWARESRALGMTLTDWIILRVEAQQMQQITPISIPPDLKFSDLKMARGADGSVSFDLAVIARIEAASGLPDGYFLAQPEEAVADLITRWYQAHLAAGGAPDATQEDLAAEVRFEDAHGGGISHQPGQA
jgi:hypothetical protein